MNLRQELQKLAKYAVPAIFAIVAIFLIVRGNQVETFDNAVCGTIVDIQPGEVTGELPEAKTKHDTVVVEQTTYFQVAGYVFLVMSIVMALFIAGVISRTVSLILLPIMAIGGIAMLFITYDTIDEISEFDQTKKKIYYETKQRMVDFKEAAVAFRTEKNRYPESIDELIDFVENDSLSFIKADDRDVPDRKVRKNEAFLLWGDGSIAEKRALVTESDSSKFKAARDKWLRKTTLSWGDSSITEQMAVKLDLISRDTMRIAVKEKLFTGPDAKKRDSNMPFDADSLKYVAYSGGIPESEFIYRYKSIKRVDPEDSTVTYKHRFELRMPEPKKAKFSDNECEPKETLIMGSLDSDKLSGNW